MAYQDTAPSPSEGLEEFYDWILQDSQDERPEPTLFRFPDVGTKNPEVANQENRSKQNEWLCENCRPIVDWHYHERGLSLAGELEFEPDHSCSLCRSFISWIQNVNGQARCTIRVGFSCIMYAVDRSPSFFIRTKPYDNERAKHFVLADAGCHKIPETIHDWGYIKECIQLCQDTHSGCGVRKVPGFPVGFRVIECHTNDIVGHPHDEPYLCLSYVWGSASNKAQEGYYPQVVVDAIRVTRALGFRYLWVDKYCISRNDSQRMHVMLSQMDRIYSQSILTIVASAGTSSDDGLPGVSTPRTRHQTFLTPRYEIVEWYWDEESSIHESVWSKRAWTLQEGLLSPRLLFFTKRQVVLLCNGGICEELGSSPQKVFKKYNADVITKRSLRLRGGINCHSLNDLVHHIQDFSRRQMTYAEDSLKAFLGILGYFARLEEPIHHIWGIPLHGKRPLLEWKHGNWGLETRLPVLPNYGSRRPIAPSWSWSGWDGPVSYASGLRFLKDFDDKYYTNGTFDYTVFASNDLDDLDMETCSKMTDSAEKPSLLRIIAPTVKLRLTKNLKTSNLRSPGQKVKWYGKANPNLWAFGCGMVDCNDPRFDLLGWDSPGWWKAYNPAKPGGMAPQAAVFDISATVAVAAEINMDANMTLEDGTLGLILARTGWDDWSSLYCGNVAILVLKETGDHFERVGIIYLAGGSLRRDSTLGEAAYQVYTDHSGAVLDEVVLFDNVRHHDPERLEYPPGVEDPGLPPWIGRTERKEILLG